MIQQRVAGAQTGGRIGQLLGQKHHFSEIEFVRESLAFDFLQNLLVVIVAETNK